MLVGAWPAVVTVVGVFDSGMPDMDRSFAEVPLGFFQDVFYMEGAGHSVVLMAPVPESVSKSISTSSDSSENRL